MKRLLLLITMFLITPTFANGYYELKPLATEKEGKARFEMMKKWAKEHPGVPRPLTPEEDYAIFGKDNLPRPSSGVHIIPANKMHYDQSQVKDIKSNASLLKNKGYIEKYNQNAATLLMFHQIANADYSKSDNLGEQSTHLRHHLSELKMAYDYQGVPDSLVKEIIGFAPESTFIANGWTGAIEFFSPKGLDGLCSYHEINIRLTGSSANFAKEIVSTQVNNKVTIIEVSGNDASGYGYNIEWWDDNFRHTLECASKTFTPAIKQQVILLATQIDSQKN